MINTKLQRLLDGYLDQLIDQEIYKVEKNKLVESKEVAGRKSAHLRTNADWLDRTFFKMDRPGRESACSRRVWHLLDKKSAAKQMFGSNLQLSASEASGQYKTPGILCYLQKRR